MKSDEYEELSKKIFSIDNKLLVIDNRLEIFNSNWRKLSAKVAVLNREMKEDEAEKIIKSDKVYL